MDSCKAINERINAKNTQYLFDKEAAVLSPR
jgi:hypothetical protein